MNGILAKIGVEQLILIVLALAAVLGVLANLGGAFWCTWLAVATIGLVTSQWHQHRLATGVD